jgi:GTP-binding protein YchF
MVAAGDSNCRVALGNGRERPLDGTWHGFGGAPYAAVDSTPVALTIGIVGLPNAGKSTLFNALTKNNVLAANYPFATIEPNVGVVGVPDDRLGKLAEIFGSDRLLPATVEFVDIAGIVRGASEGEGLGNKFLSHIRESSAICQVTRVFRDEDVTHVDGDVNPESDISTIQTEMILADLQTVDKAIPRLEKEARGNKELIANLEAAREAKEQLETGTPIISTTIDRDLVRELSLLTAKPYIYVFNCDADELGDESLKEKMRNIVGPSEAIFLDAKFESELVELGDDDEAREMLAELGVDEPGLDVLAHVGFDTLGLQTYLTAGPKEVRAWTIRKGATAPEAAGVIHTDFQRGFIKAEIVSYDDLVAAGSMAAARSAGKVRMEGKDYVMAEGDVVEFRFGPTATSKKA